MTGDKIGNGQQISWKEFDVFQNMAEFRGYTKATLDSINQRLDNQDHCIKENDTAITALRTDFAVFAAKYGAIAGIAAAVVVVGFEYMLKYVFKI